MSYKHQRKQKYLSTYARLNKDALRRRKQTTIQIEKAQASCLGASKLLLVDWLNVVVVASEALLVVAVCGGVWLLGSILWFHQVGMGKRIAKQP